MRCIKCKTVIRSGVCPNCGHVVEEREKVNPMAIVSLVLGILSMLAFVFGIVFSVPGLIFGLIAKKDKVRRTAGASIGILLSVMQIAMTALAGILILIVAFIGN